MRLATEGSQQPKQPFKQVLENAIVAIQHLTVKQLGERRKIAELFVTKGKEAIRLGEAYSRDQTTSRLKQLVESIHELNQVGDLQPLLDLLSNHDLSPTSQQKLVNVIHNVSRYRDAAQYLYRTVMKFPIARHMRAVIVSLPDEAFQETPTADYVPVLTTTISRITGGQPQPEIIHLCQSLQSTESQVAERFADQTRKILRESKLHAEVQLVYYCDLNYSRTPPRVIRSVKDACFLCNAFISTHGKMYTPRHHGRLCPGWRLPSCSLSPILEQQFVTMLEKQVKDSLEALIPKRLKTKHPTPNESIVPTFSEISTPTLHKALVGEVFSPKKMSKQTGSLDAMVSAPEQRDLRPVSAPVTVADTPIGSVAGRARLANIDEEEDMYQRINSTSPRTDKKPIPIARPDTNRTTTKKAKEVSKNHTRIPPAFDLYIYGPLHIHLERTSKSPSKSSAPTPPRRRYNCKRLDLHEAKTLRKAKNATIVDVEALDTGKEHTFELLTRETVYLRARGVVVKIARRGRAHA
ncbi:hypothetical protein NX059_002403 [Plenodomus lindquistii]|nr:hypothetical protein NX059_002403 [Plenodomus lindquistii]